MQVLPPRDISISTEKYARVEALLTGTYDPELSLFEHFRRIADIMDDAPAILHFDTQLTYRALLDAVERLAARLVDAGIGHGDRVGILAERGPEAIVAMLATTRIGASYTPLVPTYHEAQIGSIIADIEASALIAGADLLTAAHEAAPEGCKVLDATSNEKPTFAQELPAAQGDDIAYVLYTSGSTGKPKGVRVRHRGIARIVYNQPVPIFVPGERILNCCTLAGDISAGEIWGALLSGASVAIVEEARASIDAIGSAMRRHQANVALMYPGIFHLLIDSDPDAFASLRVVTAGGDTMSVSHVRKLQARFPNLKIGNKYGPTETTIFTHVHILTADDLAGSELPLGHPIGHTDSYVLDENLKPVKPGEQGQCVIGGHAVAAGYLNRPDTTAASFVDHPLPGGTGKVYLTGDMVELTEDGNILFRGRVDRQVKLGGRRIELDEIEISIRNLDEIADAAVGVGRVKGRDPQIVAFMKPTEGVATGDALVASVRASLAATLPDTMIPRSFEILDEMPLSGNGKTDRKGLIAGWETRASEADARRKAARTEAKAENADEPAIDRLALARYIEETWSALVNADDIGTKAQFFDVGGTSMMALEFIEMLRRDRGLDLSATDFFDAPTIEGIVTRLAGTSQVPDAAHRAPTVAARDQKSDLIAIVGMAGRFPGARSVSEFWQGLVEGREMISHFSEDELEIDPRDAEPDTPYVLSRGTMIDADKFDALHFGIPPREAERLDPQHRIMLEVAQTALEDAGHDPDRFAGKIGIFCGASQSSYLLNNLLGAPGAARQLAAGYPVKDFATLFGNDKEFIATRVAYKLNLKGPAMTVQTACSTALTAVSQACNALREGQADMVLAGAVSVTFPTKRPYAYLPEGMASGDGHCRTFDAEASGTVFGDGAGLVVLRRLEDALADGDDVIAVIRGVGINNDGAEKAGYAAPSIRAQSDAILTAHRNAGIAPRQIGFVEAHGTATPLGDPIEFTALQTAFGAGTEERQFCALSSAKTNIGHLDVAAGVAGLIKAALVLKHEKIPPLLHFTKPNPRIDFEDSAFYPVTEVTDWSRGDTPRMAGVSAFGVGGTNVHLVLEEAPTTEQTDPTDANALRVFPVSGTSPDAIAASITELGAFAADSPAADPDRVVATLREGRRTYGQRAVLVARDMASLAEAAATHKGTPTKAAERAGLAFLFPGQGAQHVGMARHLREGAPVFRDALEECTRLLEPELGLNLLDIIHPPADQAEAMTERLRDTALAQPAIFATSYALAKQWDHWGVTPDVMVGHSIGEFVAATLAGVMALPDALKLIALRGRLMADLPRGLMVSVRATEDEILPYLGAGLDLAAVNGAKAVVIAGSEEACDAILPKIEADGFVASKLHTSHAFHSHMMEPALAPFQAAIEKLTLGAPKRPILSTVTGDWLTDDEATSAEYWAMHMRRPVRFYDAIQVLWAEGQHMFLEAGPGRTLATLAGQNPDRGRAQPALSSLPHAQAEDADSHAALLESFGLLWANGYPVDWSRIDDGRPKARRLPGLPTYPFQRKRHWIEPAALTVGDTTDELPAVAPDEAEATPLPPADAGMAVRQMLEDLSGVEPDDMDGTATFLELGFDSLLLTQATREISDRFGVTVTLRELIDGLPNIDTLAAHIEANGNLSGAAPADKTKVGWMAEIERPAPKPDTKPVQTSAPMTTISRDAEEITSEQRAHIDALVARFNARTPKSKALTQQYRQYHADPRTAAGFNRLWKDAVYQVVSHRSKGSRFIDVDGNEYLDLLNGFGPGFFGHTNEMVVDPVQERLNRGFEVGPQHLEAMEAAQLFCEVTGNERASFVCTGSEAVYAAMRLARTVTNRDKIVIFQRDYHGNFDEVLVRGLEGKDGPRTLPLTPGIPRASVENIVVLPYGTPQSLDWIRAHADTLAAVVVEPVQSRRPEWRPAEFVREVRRITERSGALMVMDEVVTGFRFGPRGAQAYFGVEADLVTYGKIVGGEMPVGVVAGKARYMDTFDGGQWTYGDGSFPEAPVTFFAGTFVRHPLAMAALRAVLLFLKKQPELFWRKINAKGDHLAGTVNRWFEDNDMPFELPNCGSLMYLRIGEDQKFGNLLGVHLRARGLYLLEGFPSYLTAAHDDEDLAFAIDAYKDAALEMRAGGLLTGRETVPYDGPHVTTAPPRLSLPDGEERIAAQMAAPVGAMHVPTTAAQQEIWTALQFTPELNLAYNESVRLDLRGTLDADLLQKAVSQVVERHDALRSTFTADGTEMVIHPDMDLDIRWTDLTDDPDREQTLAAALRREVEVELDLANGPLARAELLRMTPEHHVLIVTAHHIVCDGWSIDVVIRDLGKIYAALVAGTQAALEPVQSIIDYTAAEAAWRKTEAAETVRHFWMDLYQGDMPVIEMPTDRPRGNGLAMRGARLDLAVPADLTERLRAMARRENLSFVTLLFAAWSLQMSRLVRNEDMIIGMPAAGQSARGMPGVVGHCVHFLPIRTAVPQDISLKSYLMATRNRFLDVFDHQTYTLGELVRDLNVPRSADRRMLTPLVFNHDMGIDLSELSFGSTASTLATNTRTVEVFDIFLNLTDRTDTILAEWSYNADLFDADTIARYATGFVTLLEAFVDADPKENVSDVSGLRAEDRQRLLTDWQGVEVEFPSDQSLAQVFAERAAETPQATAVIAGETHVSYGALEARANELSAAMMSKGIGAGDRVGLCLDRSVDLVAAMLAVLRLDALFVPLAPNLPKARVNYLMTDSGAATVLTKAAYAQRFDFTDAVLVEEIDAGDAATVALPPLRTPAPDAAAYVAYTSGSTGQPKGVVGTHRATLNRFAWMWRAYPFETGEVMCQKTAISFVDSIWEILGPLLAGVPQVVIPEEVVTEPRRFLETLGDAGVTRLLVVPSLLRALLESDLALGEIAPSLRLLFTSGETLPGDLARQFLDSAPNVTLINLYGSSEVAADVTVHEITAADLDGGAAPIGRAIDNARLYVLDSHHALVPVGTTGELYVGGAALAAGYLGRDELTAERFLPDPFKPGGRMFATGDLVRWRADGALMYEGRADDQIKLRGYRIEMGEIESTLTAIDGVSSAAVVLQGDGTNAAFLAAAIVPQNNVPIDEQALRAELGAVLPDYMIPAYFQTLDALPLNTSGKVDRRALRSLLVPQAPIASVPSDTPLTEDERRLTELWRSFFPGRDVGPDDSFFDVGGHSLMAVSLFDRIRREMGHDLPISTLLRHQTPRALAAVLADEGPTQTKSTSLSTEDWDTSTVIHPGPEGADTRPVFIVGGIGGNVNNFYEMGQHLAQKRGLVGFMNRGVMGHEPRDTFEEMAAEHIRYMRQHQSEGPYVIAGYSGGGYTALEMVRQLEAAGEEVEHLLVFDIYAPEFTKKLRDTYKLTWRERLSEEMVLVRKQNLGTLATRAFWKVFSRLAPRLNKLKKVNVSVAEARHKYMRQKWLAAAQNYTGGPVETEVTLFWIDPDPNLVARIDMAAIAIDPTYGWKALAPENKYRGIRVAGTHAEMFVGDNSEILATRIEQILSGDLPAGDA
ncbi:MAG: amino acid adenylation domain-containing protein [Pseudomonadota bacterium]